MNKLSNLIQNLYVLFIVFVIGRMAINIGLSKVNFMGYYKFSYNLDSKWIISTIGYFLILIVIMHIAQKLITSWLIFTHVKIYLYILPAILIGIWAFPRFVKSFVTIYGLINYGGWFNAVYDQSLLAGMNNVFLLSNIFQNKLFLAFGEMLIYTYLFSAVNSLSLFFYKDIDKQHHRMKVKLWKGGLKESNNIKVFSDRKIKNLKNLSHTADKTLIGLSQSEKVYLPDQALAAHALVLGGSGVGKTTLLMNVVEHYAQAGLPVAFVDGKGSPDLKEKVALIAKAAGRKFDYFSLDDQASNTYNLLANGNKTELKDRIVSATNWSDDHYRLQAENYLQMAFDLILTTHGYCDYQLLGEEMQPSKLIKYARKYGNKTYVEKIQAAEAGGVDGLINRIQTVAESSCGHLFAERNGGINLKNVFSEGRIALFQLSPLKFPEIAHLIGSCLVNDIKSSITLVDNRQKLIILDEFTTFAGTQALDLVNKGREFGANLMLSTQVLSDFELNDGGTQLKNAVTNSTNVKIIFRNTDSSVEEISAMAGTQSSFKVSQRADWQNSSATGIAGTIAEEKSYVLHPDTIRNLHVGQAAVFWGLPEPVKPKVISVRQVNFQKYKDDVSTTDDMFESVDLSKTEHVEIHENGSDDPLDLQSII